MILDIYDDNGAYLKKVSGSGFTQALELGAMTNMKLAGARFDEDYAVVVPVGAGVKHAYPLVDEANTALSALYFAEFGDQLEPKLRKTAAENISTALQAFGLGVPSAIEKTASMNVTEVGPTTGADKALLDEFNLDAEGWEVVEDAFDGCDPTMRRRIVMRMKTAGKSIPTGWSNYAGDEVGKDFGYALDLRSGFVGDVESHMMLNMLREKQATAKPEELVAELEEFDRRNHLSFFYDSQLPDPVASVYGSSIEDSLWGGDVPKVAEITSEAVREHEARLRETYGDSMVDQLAKDPESVFNSLPDPHKEAVRQIING